MPPQAQDGVSRGLSKHIINRQRRQLSRVVAVGLAVAIATAPTSSVAADPPDFSGQGLTSSGSESAPKAATSRLAQSDPAVLQATGTAEVPVLVKLDYDSVATYTGGVQNLQPTSPSATSRKLDENTDAVKQYESYVAGVEGTFTAQLSAAIPDATVGTRLRTVFGGVAVTVPADRAKDLLELPGVVAVQADQLNHPQTDSSPEFIGAPTLYSALGSDKTAGQGAIVGVLDTGAWPEHPSFADPGIGAPSAKADGTPRVCDFGDNPLTPENDPFVCNNKLISGEPFLDTYNAIHTGETYATSARDSDGHGTHTASTSAGAAVDHATVLGIDRGAVHGIAPGAHVAVYKVCGAAGCFSSDAAAAVAQAIKDGVNVINFSISGGAQPFADAVELAFLDAYAAGVFVSASAGNSGPGVGTTDHHGPWVTTVAASTQQRAFQSTLTVQSGGATYTTVGASITAGVTSPTPVVLSSAAPYGDVQCAAPAEPGIFDGKIVACPRGGGISRVDKGHNVLQGGAAGMILYNPSLADVETDNHWLPAVQLADGTDFLAFMTAHPDATATFTAGEKATGQGDVMAAFSSRGPGGDWLKPDLTAPGVQILAGNTPTPDNITVGPPGQYYQAIAGTSMSSPHVAGSAALIVSLHPDWTPGQIKSALMTTATTAVVKDDLTTPADPYDFGAGRIDLTKAGDPGLTFDATAADFHAAATDTLRKGVDINVPSINIPGLAGAVTTARVAKNVTNHRLSYRATVKAPAGATITVTPSTFDVNPGQSIKLKIEINGGKLPSDDTTTPHFGQITLDEVSGTHDLHLPVAFTRGQGSLKVGTDCAPTTITLYPRTDSTCTVTATNTGNGSTTVDGASTMTDRLEVTSITGAVSNGRGGVRLNPVELAGKKLAAPGIAAATSTPRGYLPLDARGVAPQVIGDEQILNYTVPAFVYAGESYTKVGVTSDGYLVVGGGTASDIRYEPQTLPDPVQPNNVLAPFWTDLDGTGAPGVFVGHLTDGGNNWLVVEWRVFAWGTTDLEVFQAWIGLNGTEDITYTYDPTNLPTQPDGQNLTVGAENADGSAGAQIAGAPTGDLRVASDPGSGGASVSYQFKVRGVRPGNGQILTTLTSPAVAGKTLEWDIVPVNRN